jgi:hypothetical protein
MQLSIYINTMREKPSINTGSATPTPNASVVDTNIAASGSATPTNTNSTSIIQQTLSTSSQTPTPDIEAHNQTAIPTPTSSTSQANTPGVSQTIAESATPSPINPVGTNTASAVDTTTASAESATPSPISAAKTTTAQTPTSSAVEVPKAQAQETLQTQRSPMVTPVSPKPEVTKIKVSIGEETIELQIPKGSVHPMSTHARTRPQGDATISDNTTDPCDLLEEVTNAKDKISAIKKILEQEQNDSTKQTLTAQLEQAIYTLKQTTAKYIDKINSSSKHIQGTPVPGTNNVEYKETKPDGTEKVVVKQIRDPSSKEVWYEVTPGEGPRTIKVPRIINGKPSDICDILQYDKEGKLVDAIIANEPPGSKSQINQSELKKALDERALSRETSRGIDARVSAQQPEVSAPGKASQAQSADRSPSAIADQAPNTERAVMQRTHAETARAAALTSTERATDRQTAKVAAQASTVATAATQAATAAAAAKTPPGTEVVATPQAEVRNAPIASTTQVKDVRENPVNQKHRTISHHQAGDLIMASAITQATKPLPITQTDALTQVSPSATPTTQQGRNRSQSF